MEKLRPIMFVGTGSDVGKSVINTGICRIFKQDGYRPAPFKAQNMSLNSYVTFDGREIGRAQAVQAEACGIDCMVEMNPVLLKPTGEQMSQVILNGRPIKNVSAREYFRTTDREELFAEVKRGFNRLSEQYNPIVIEGAGSISELNLKDKDIVNMKVAVETQAATYLIADIDRGGVFASLYGSIMLLTPEERAVVKGIIINKFRGDVTLFEEGKNIIESLTGVPVVGIVPYANDINIEQEDGVVLDDFNFKALPSFINIGVPRLKHISNFTDFSLISKIPNLNVFFTRDPHELEKSDIIILPGTKNTISDAIYLLDTGMKESILKHHKEGKPVYGICGGYQLMGIRINDPERIEGETTHADGLGILPVETTLTKEKKTRRCFFKFHNSDAEGEGYEIHMGHTDSSSPLLILDNGDTDGYFLNNRTWGTYVHGILDNPSVINSIIREIDSNFHTAQNYKQLKEESYNDLANLLRKHLDIDYIYKSLKLS